MKSISYYLIIVIALSLVFSNASFAQKYVFGENAQKQGIHLLSNDKSSLKITHAVHEFVLEDVDVHGETMKQLNFGMNIIPAEAGMPDLRSVSRYILIPDGAQIELKILQKEEVLYENMEIAPAALVPFDTEKKKPALKGPQYAKNEMFPKSVVESELTEVRGMTMALVSINPFRYNPVTKDLLVYKNLEVEVNIVGGKGNYGETRFRNRYWDQILDDLVFNSGDIPELQTQENHTKNSENNGCEYLIIIPDQDDFKQWADSIKLFRTEQGIATKVKTISDVGSNTVAEIKDYINTVYETWDPVPSAVLLMADYGNDDNTITSNSYSHPYDGIYITDNYYADYTGNDLPDFVFARMTARNASELETMVTKFIDYERNPPLDAYFYNNPITALGWQTERWFQICSETIGGYMSHVLGKEPVRINAVYDGNPNSDPWSTATNTNQVLDYFGPNGQGYIPATPGELGGWTGGNASDVANALNNGAFILQHRDHGGNSGWGEPDFDVYDINQLNNIDELSHIFSINCLTGQFNSTSECFTEKFHRHSNGGALSLTAASQVSYSFVNDAFVWGMYDNMWPDFMPDYGNVQIEERDFRPAFGCASGKYFLSSSNWPYNSGSKQITYRLFHHHGDAFNMVYTEVPEELQVVYTEGINDTMDFVQIQVDEGALIAFSVNGELIGTGVGTSNMQQITIIPQMVGTDIKVVVTKQNYLRHEGIINVLPADGPYLLQTNFSINDENGNNNQLADIGEDIGLDITVKNIGSETAINASAILETNDAFVEITDGDVTLGTFSSNQEEVITDAFELSIANNTPDQHQVNFVLTATNGTDEWQSNFNFKVNAPKPQIGTFTIDDSSGGDGDGVLEPGESAEIEVELLNSGHCDSDAGQFIICSLSEDINIETSSVDVEAISQQSQTTISFSATANAGAEYGSVALVDLEFISGNYCEAMVWEISLGNIIEDFETGNYDQFDWQFGSNSWSIVGASQAYEGNYASVSDDITNYENSEMYLNYTVETEGILSFYYKVSSESSFDYLRFYINGVEQDKWSGIHDWSLASYNVQPGDYIFSWKYTKDVSISIGSDCAWVDMISFPSSSENQSMVYQTPIEKSVISGQVFTTKVKIGNVEDLGGFNIHMDFDTDLLQVNSITVGDFIGSSGREIGVTTDVIDNINGLLEYHIQTVGEAAGVNGSGNLLSIEWQANEDIEVMQETILAFNGVYISNTANENIPVDLMNTTVTIGNCYEGDMDCDCDVDIIDVTTVAYAYDTSLGDPEYNPLYDMDSDNDIDIVDITMVAYHYGWSCNDNKSATILKTDNTNVILSIDDQYSELEEVGYLNLLINGVEQLGAYELNLSFIPQEIEILELNGGKLLNKTNREILELASSINNGMIQYAITSLGSETNGANGSGELLSIKYRKKTPNGSIQFENGQIVRIDGEIIPFEIDQVLGLQNNIVSQARIYPIPMKDILHIEYQIKEVGDIEFELQDINGKIIFNWKENHSTTGLHQSELHRNGLESGTYLLKIKDDKYIWKQMKLIIH